VSKSQYDRLYPSLDLVRVISIVAIVIHHLPHYIPFSAEPAPQLMLNVARRLWILMPTFFVLSGFLIADIYFRTIENHGQHPILRFYLGRCFKILPSYFLVLAVSCWQASFFSLSSLPYYAVFLQNMHSLPVFLHSWSLCVEEQFYLVFPLLMLAWKAKMSRQIMWSMLGIAFASFLYLFCASAAHMLDYNFQEVPYSTELANYYYGTLYFDTWPNLHGLAFGVMIAIASRLSHAFQRLVLHHSVIIHIIGWGVIVYAGSIAEPRISFTASTIVPALAAVGSALIIASCSLKDAVVNRIRSRTLTKLSICTYSIYLTHTLSFDLALNLAKRFSDHLWLQEYIHFVAIGIVAAVGIATYQLFERPIYEMRIPMFHWLISPRSQSTQVQAVSASELKLDNAA